MSVQPIVRVQSRHDGRGPYRPGITTKWADRWGPDLPDIITEFGAAWVSEIPDGWASGCGFLSLAVLRRWFSPRELRRLKELGFHVVEMDADRIIRVGAMQVIFARRLPLVRDVRPVRSRELRQPVGQVEA